MIKTLSTTYKKYRNLDVETCIKAVCDLAGCEPDRLPSKSTLANIMVEAKAVSHGQIAECIPTFDTNMLHSDGTTKFGEKYGGLQVTTPDSCYILCLTTMKAGGTNNFKELLSDALSDVSETCQAIGNDAGVSTKSHEEKEKLFKPCIKIGREQRQIAKVCSSAPPRSAEKERKGPCH